MHILVTLAIALPLVSHAKLSKDPAKKGLEIAKILDKQDDGFKDQKSNMKMVLRDRHGRESVRVIQNQALEVKGDGDKSMSSFSTPKTVKGTKFLSFTHKTGPDDQWLYLPKLKRVKRISSNNKSGPFMGSEFAYEDIASQEVEKYTYKFIKDEACGKEKCHIIERYPTDKNSGYSKQIVSIIIGDGKYRPIKIEFYDVKKTHLKTLSFDGYKQYEGQYWRPGTMKMVNHATGKSTDLVFTNYKFKTGLTKRDFDKNSLKR